MRAKHIIGQLEGFSDGDQNFFFRRKGVKKVVQCRLLP
jgi:hypothetical protein